VPAASVRTVKDVLSLLGQYPLTGERAVLTRRAVALRAHCGNARLGFPAVDHHHPLLTRAAL
jgi:hypothetical protein